MIAAWMLHTVVLTAVVGLATWAADYALFCFRRPRRFVWLAALVLSAGVAAARAATQTASSVVGDDASGSVGVTDRPEPAREVSVLPAAQATTGVAARIRAVFARELTVPVARGLGALDRPLGVLWGTASLAWLVLLARSAARLRRQRAEWRREILDGVPVYLSHDVGPALVGVVRYGIVLPAWVAELAPSRRRLILAHEREHARANDPVTLLVGALILAAQPWNPAAWLLFRRLRLAIEADCDARVLALAPDVRLYGELLLDVGERVLAGVAPVAALSEPHSDLARRISIMTSRPRTHAMLRSAGALASTILLTVAATRLPRPAAAATPPTNVSTATATGERVIVRLASTGLLEADPTPTVLVYATGRVLVGVGTETLRPLTDTLRLASFPAMTFDVTDGEAHLELVGRGRLQLAAFASNGPAPRYSATGHHVVILQGGIGLRPLSDGDDTRGASTPPARRVGYTGFTIRNWAKVDMSAGRTIESGYPTVNEVRPGTPAEAAGLKVDDVILSVNDLDARTAGALLPIVGERYAMRVRRGSEEMSFVLIPVPKPVFR